MTSAIPASVWTNPDVRLRVWFNDGSNGSQLLTPDQRLAPTGYLADGAVAGPALATGAVTSAKIASGAVGSAQLAANVAVLDSAQTFTGQTTFNNPANSFTGSSFTLGNGAGLIGDQGGSLELGDSLQTGTSPFIDFHFGTGTPEDFNVRLINNGAGLLSLLGRLNVSGAISAPSLFVNNGIIQRGGAPLAATADLGLYSQLDGAFVRFVTNAAPFQWYSDGGVGTTPSMALTPGGNLGIGTTAPQARLHVAGNLRLDGDAMNAAGRLHLQTGENLYLNPFGGDSFVGYGGGPGNLYVGGNVGIGTDSPSTKLEVAGAIKATSATIPNLSGNVAIGGALSAASVTFPVLNGNVAVTGTLSAPSATIPTLNGNVTVAGEVTANVVTVLGGSDVAEPYEVAPAGDIEPIPGMVVAIDSRHVGQMRVAERAYDKTVAGILSGANGIAPGITLRQVGTVADGSRPVASIGRVWCYVDADANGPIEAGDMLTTSDTPGHAMKVDDHTLANGAVIGKAMSGLASGKGLVLVLVSLK